ncbi:unnamed protein product [Effrenium voratum]|nr:unnamed protein product [Effrenium voratum]
MKKGATKGAVAAAVGLPLACDMLAFTSPSSQPAPRVGTNAGTVAGARAAAAASTSSGVAGPVATASVLAGAASVLGKRRAKGPKASPTARLSTTTVLEKAATEATEPGKILERYVKDKGGSRVLRKLLIANNGMAATKAILSLRQWAYLELGLDNAFEFVVMATPEDLEANAEFIRLANSYVEVPGGKNVNNYANVDLIVDIAKSQGVDAVWPGWGHASENPKLPDGLKEPRASRERAEPRRRGDGER